MSLQKENWWHLNVRNLKRAWKKLLLAASVFVVSENLTDVWVWLYPGILKLLPAFILLAPAFWEPSLTRSNQQTGIQVWWSLGLTYQPLNWCLVSIGQPVLCVTQTLLHYVVTVSPATWELTGHHGVVVGPRHSAQAWYYVPSICTGHRTWWLLPQRLKGKKKHCC